MTPLEALLMDLVLAGFTAEKTEAALRFCERALVKLPLGRRLLVMNSQEEVCLPATHWRRLDGSNEFGEFSAWQEGLDALGHDDDVPVIFLNDTIAFHRRFSNWRSWAFIHEARHADARCVVGFVDDADNDIGDLSIDGLVLQGWVSSYLFMLGPAALRLLGRRLYVPQQVERCVDGGDKEAAFFSQAVSPDLQRHLRAWLFQGGWYRSEPLRPSNQAMFERKAKIICAELLLSARCWAVGCSRRDPFQLHPLACQLDETSERWIRRLRFTRGPWIDHPRPWQRRAERPEVFQRQ
jgi:hypothetical protein